MVASSGILELCCLRVSKERRGTVTEAELNASAELFRWRLHVPLFPDG